MFFSQGVFGSVDKGSNHENTGVERATEVLGFRV